MNPSSIARFHGGGLDSAPCGTRACKANRTRPRGDRIDDVALSRRPRPGVHGAVWAFGRIGPRNTRPSAKRAHLVRAALRKHRALMQHHDVAAALGFVRDRRCRG